MWLAYLNLGYTSQALHTKSVNKTGLAREHLRIISVLRMCIAICSALYGISVLSEPLFSRPLKLFLTKASVSSVRLSVTNLQQFNPDITHESFSEAVVAESRNVILHKPLAHLVIGLHHRRLTWRRNRIHSSWDVWAIGVFQVSSLFVKWRPSLQTWGLYVCPDTRFYEINVPDLWMGKSRAFLD